jgi:tetratricopeptide (TPR) repeat protein
VSDPLNALNDETPGSLRGSRVAFVGKLASMSKRDAARLAREHGAVVVDPPDPSVDLVVVGETLSFGVGDDADELLDPEVRRAAEQGTLRIVPETELWQRLGLVETEQDVRRLYTPAMLAELLGVPVAVIRRWHRRGLIVPVREVRRLPYFDFQEVATARRLAELLAAGTSPAAIEKKLGSLARYLPGVRRPLAQLSVIIEGKAILLRQGDGLIEPGGQLRFDFGAPEGAGPEEPRESGEDSTPATAEPHGAGGVLSMAKLEHVAGGPGAPEETAALPEQICRMAARLEDEGHLEAAVEMYRAALAAAGPVPEICFLVAELLYRLGDVSAARERYYMTIELDENYVEARVNLGCLLAETGQHELAAAAFEGALAYHGEYADAHYHLARTLDELGRRDEAESHWRSFLELAPDSPWADQARGRLAEQVR